MAVQAIVLARSGPQRTRKRTTRIHPSRHQGRWVLRLAQGRAPRDQSIVFCLTPFNKTQSEPCMETLDQLFEETTRDIYYAEKKILKALPKMAKKASSPKLAKAFEMHIAETEQHVERLDQIFELLGKAARGKTCPAIDGIIEEGEEIMKEVKDPTVRDAGMLAAAQAVEHYEITRYGTLKSWAGKLGMTDAVKLIDATLKEEKATDVKLTDLAESEINIEAGEEDDTSASRKTAGGRRS
ncbi:ferritin-like domain-containing protein [Leptospira interrogans]